MSVGEAQAEYGGPVPFEFDLDSGDVRLGRQAWGRATVPDRRRFCWRFELVTERDRYPAINLH